ncbi:unnamed protein product [Paramecium sonneborni]|uniref:Uncharacterized protein n=1 Tax=Paramecium sonneborni TaxID=65129 RepID=A0A8S1MIL5_9CILI|nr:unnamed protein product [Paramecium sonneborni]
MEVSQVYGLEVVIGDQDIKMEYLTVIGLSNSIRQCLAQNSKFFSQSRWSRKKQNQNNDCSYLSLRFQEIKILKFEQQMNLRGFFKGNPTGKAQKQMKYDYTIHSACQQNGH